MMRRGHQRGYRVLHHWRARFDLIDPRTGYPAQAVAQRQSSPHPAPPPTSWQPPLYPGSSAREFACGPDAWNRLPAGDLLRHGGVLNWNSELPAGNATRRSTGKTAASPICTKEPWPQGFLVNIAFELLKPTSGKISAPMAICAEDTRQDESAPSRCGQRTRPDIDADVSTLGQARLGAVLHSCGSVPPPVTPVIDGWAQVPTYHPGTGRL